jgi:FdhE protein
MDLKSLDAALKAYQDKLPEETATRLAFFRGLWEIQDRNAHLVADQVGYEVATPAQLKQWYWAEKPFFLQSPATIDIDLFVSALEEVAGYLADHAGLDEGNAATLRTYDWRALVAEELSQAGYDPADYIETIRERAEKGDSAATSSLATLVVALGLRAMLEPAARAAFAAVPDLVEDNLRHDKPLRCPVCGGQATLAYVGDTASSQGKGRELYCATCGTVWEFERIRCARCGSTNQGKLHYFHLEGDDAHRLHECEECGDYIRTTFAEDVVAPFVPEVEDVVMTDLDQVAHDPRFLRDE